jgi:hypothetical protein
MPAFWYTNTIAASSRWFSRFERVSARVAIERSTDSSSAPIAKAMVMRARRPSRRVSGNRRTAAGQTWSL